MKKITKILLLCAVLVLGCTGEVWAFSSHNAKLQAMISSTSPSGSGRVYVSQGDEPEESPDWDTTKEVTKDAGSGNNATFFAYAEAGRGYKFDSWNTLSGDGDPQVLEEIGGANNVIKVQVTASTTDYGTNTATIQANFVDNDVPQYNVQYVSASHGTYTAVGPVGYDTVTIDGDAIATWNTDKITLTATPADGWQFYRWIIKDENGIKETLGEALTNPLTTTLPAHARTVSAEFITDANFMVGESAFKEFADALQFAAASAVGGEEVLILQLKDYTIPAGTYTLPAGVTLLVPWSASQQTPAGPAPDYEANKSTVGSQYRRLTLASGVTMHVYGTIEVGGRQNSNGQGRNGSGNIYGNYGRMHLSEGSSMTLNSGAQLIAWGFVTGTGTIDARRGSICYEMFQIMDFRGGSMTSGYADWWGNAKEHAMFPFHQYYIQNIEVPVTFHPGAREKTSMCAAQTQVPDVWIIGIRNKKDGSADDIALFLMDDDNDSEDTWVRKSYDATNDRQKYDINSSAYLSNIEFTVSGITFNSGAGYVLPITNNMDIHLLSGEMGIIQDVSFLSGATLEVDKEAAAYIQAGKSVFFFDADDWGVYSYSEQIANPVMFSPSWSGSTSPRDVSSGAALGDANLNLHGTFRADGAIYTTAGGSNITSTNDDAGTIIFVSDAPTAQKSVWMSKDKYDNGVELPSNPALLQNGDGTTATTINTAAGKSYCYKNGKWTLMDVDPDNECFVLDNYGTYYAKPGEYVAINATKDPDTKISGNSDHTFSDAAGGGRLFILMDDCQWWEVVFENNRYHKKVEAGSTEAPKYYEYDNEQGKWVDYRYSIKWLNWDGTLIEEYKLTAGTEPKYLGTNPSRPEDIDYTYNFTGWSPALATVSGDATYTATYDAVEKKYLIRFLNENCGEIERYFLKRGELPVCSAEPAKAGHYLVWSPTIANVTGAQDYKATYLENEPTEFTITWKNFDGTEIYHETVAKGATPSYNTSAHGTPVKTIAGSEYNYTFTGWSPAVVAVTTNAAYTATFSEAKKTYAIKFFAEDGTTQIGETQNLEAGTNPVVPACGKANPQAGHTYSLVWSPLVSTVTKAQDYKATFTVEVQKYTVTLIGNGCTVTGSGTYDYGTSVTIKATPNPGYAFDGWSDGNNNASRSITITGNVNLTAQTHAVGITISASETKKITAPTTAASLTIAASTSASGQLLGAENLTVTGNANFDLTLNAQTRTWYAFCVPWQVDAENGVYDGTKHLILGRDFDIIYYDGAARAANGTSAENWKYVEDDANKTLQPGKAYMIYFAAAHSTLRFVKKAGTPVAFSGNVTTPAHAAADAKNANWNGIANPALYHAVLNAGVEKGQVYNNGELFSTNDGYKTITLASSKFVVGKPVFVQSGNASPVVVTLATTQTAAAPARVAAKSDKVEFEVQLLNAAGQETDNLFVQAEDEKEDVYTLGKDLVKAGVSSRQGQMWVNRYGSKLCVNAQSFADDMATYPLGIYAPAAGEYTIHLQESTSSDYNLYLTLNGEAVWNLSMSDYAAELQKETTAAYGLRIAPAQMPGTATSLEEATADAATLGDQVRKIMVNGVLYILRDEKVYTVSGQVVNASMMFNK